MTPESTPNALQQWWSETVFPAKDFYQLKDDGTLVLTLNGKPERTIATLATDNAEIVLKALQDKFGEIETKVKELQAEWDTAEDKLKLVGKVERINDYLEHTNAIGDFNTLFQPLTEMAKELAKQTNENHEAKLKLVQQAETLADSEDWKEVSQILKDLTDQWKSIGYTDKDRNDSLWNRLEAARTKFFDRKRSHQEDQGKEMLANLDLKMELVDKAEKLAASEDWKATTEAFKNLMDEWKNTGRTMHEKNEALWGRFILAKNTFFDRKRQNFEQIQGEQETNLAAKLALIERAEAMKDSTDWNETSKEYATLMDEWKAIGRVPGDKSDEIWNQLTAIKDHFFGRRKEHFETVRISLEDNLAMKMSLVKRAESLKNSTSWQDATIELNELMDEWKKTGPVPRELSKKIWEQFLAARKTFFDRKDANREQRKQKAERHITDKKKHIHSLLHTLEDELKDEQERLADFKNGLENITPGRKAEELRKHLQELISQTERTIASKQAKIESTKKQVEEFEGSDKAKTVNKEKATNKETTATATTNVEDAETVTEDAAKTINEDAVAATSPTDEAGEDADETTA